jgi:hypothetical protein
LSIYVKGDCIECGGVDVEMGYTDTGVCRECQIWRENAASRLECEYQHWHSKHKAQVPDPVLDDVQVCTNAPESNMEPGDA